MKSENQKRALQALVECPSLTAAAEQAGLSRRTLYGYLSDLRFIRALREMQMAQALERSERMSALEAQAENSLVALMNDNAQPGPVRVAAAKSLILAAADARVVANSAVNAAEMDAAWK